MEGTRRLYYSQKEIKKKGVAMYLRLLLCACIAHLLLSGNAIANDFAEGVCQTFFLICPTQPIDGCTAQINGSSLPDCPADVTTLIWNWGDGTETSGHFFPVTHEYLRDGLHHVTVVDPATAQSQSCTFNVTGCNAECPSFFLICPDEPGALPIDGCTAQINGSSLPDCPADVTTLVWNWGDGTETSGHFFPVTHEYPYDRVYNVSVTDPATSQSRSCAANLTECNSIDSDSDGIANGTDNCVFSENTDQIDTDGDGHGNACDADFNNDCLINFLDLIAMKVGFFGTDPLLDLNGDGNVNFGDLSIMKDLFFGAPGASASGSCSP